MTSTDGTGGDAPALEIGVGREIMRGQDRVARAAATEAAVLLTGGQNRTASAVFCSVKLAKFGIRIAMRIHILALNGVFDTGLAVVLDASGTANALAVTGVSSLCFRTKAVGLSKSITTAQGLSLPVAAAARAKTPDVVVTPAINRITPEPLVRALASGEVREAGAVLRKWSGRGAWPSGPGADADPARQPPFLGRAVHWYGPDQRAGFIASIVGAVIVLGVWHMIVRSRLKR